jgi:hypothetical protein
MMRTISIILFLLLADCLFGQDDDKVIHTKEGGAIGFKKSLVIQCKKSYAAPPENKIIAQVCECQVNLLDRRYSLKQIKNYQKKYKDAGLARLMEEDTLLQKEFKKCTEGANDILLLSIPDYRKNFIIKCIDNLKLGSEKPLNDTLATLFCSCAIEVMEKRKLTLEKFDDLRDPTSFLYNEIAYKCGSPYLQVSDLAKDWKAADSADIKPNYSIDSVQIISVMGMHKIKITIGNETRVWMIDSGSSDLLVSDEFVKMLKQQKIISELNFIGEGHASLANNTRISCKRYKIDKVKIGRFVIDNVILSSSNGVREFLVGKSLLNKFRSWTIDNKNNLLILVK